MHGRAAKYDVAIIGAGPAGALSALKYARRGARVLLLEASLRAKNRLAGEWLHPRAVSALASVGVELEGISPAPYPTGNGFVVLPDDGTAPIILPYSDERRGFSMEHSALVEQVREAAVASPRVDYLEHARATEVRGQRLTYQLRGRAGERHVMVQTIVGADGRASVARRTLGLENDATPYSRMAGVLVNAELPHEGFGHIMLGGPGPILAYRIGEEAVRLCLDVPLEIPYPQDKAAFLWDGYASVLPESLRPGFRSALAAGDVVWAKNSLRSRTHFGREGLVLIGDAVGHYHPLTAAGMSLAFDDASRLVEAEDFETFRKTRFAETRVPEMLAVSLYEVFADSSDETVAMRQEIYDMWRRSAFERRRTMRFLALDDTSNATFGYAFVKVATLASATLARRSTKTRHWAYAADLVRRMATRTRWLGAGAFERDWERTSAYRLRTDDAIRKYRWPRVLPPEAKPHDPSVIHLEPVRRGPTPAVALERAVERLAALQSEAGSWEGEVVWCAMLAAQYVLMCHITGTPIPRERRARLLQHFADTRGSDGTWGMHELSEPYLFVTTLVYVAARLLGVSRDDPLIEAAGRFIRRQGGVVAIPTWGKFWLAMLSLYDWRGVNPIIPEAWALPKWLPIHPSNYYCHTRQIYGAMAAIYGQPFQVPFTALIKQLRAELYPDGYEAVDFSAARGVLRPEETITPPGRALKLLYEGAGLVDRFHSRHLREGIVEMLLDRIRFELETTRDTCISPVSGLLSIIALWLANPRDPDFRAALEGFEAWIWEDDEAGLRVAGARSTTWDSGFALQALAAAAPHVDAGASISKGLEFLRTQQIRKAPEGYQEQFRIDPRGGFCFAEVWHGWPVSDCTAEAILALMELSGADVPREQLEMAVRFILRCQNADGGFGSYEARRAPVGLEWMNPAEMFGDSMSEGSYTECTASCLVALARFREQHRRNALRRDVDDAISRAAERVRLAQLPDGSFEGSWGVHFIYGTLFGIRGMLAAGAPPHDPAVRKACRWLVERQRDDGGWGEHHQSCLTGVYTEHYESQIVQTAWALTALLEAREPNREVIDRGAHFLARMQQDDGQWPKQDPAGVFFRTALLDYVLYRSYFPVLALGLYQTHTGDRLTYKRPMRSAAIA